MRSRSTASCSRRRSRTRSRAEPLIELRREEVQRHRSGTHHDHRHRTAHQRCAGRGDRTAHRLRPPVFLRQHQPDCGRRDRRHEHRLPGVALWASRSTAPTTTSIARSTSRSTRRSSDALLGAQAVSAHIPEDDACYFEACLPIEEMARRGRDTLRFGPMKPMGLTDPRTGRRPWAVVQLRQENLRSESYNLVGFQNHLKFGEQARMLRMIPGLEHAEFLRFGQIHRNTYINAPALLDPTLQLRAHPRVFFAGQISGVEGYVESIATGLMAGMHAAGAGAGESRGLSRARPRSARCAITSPAPTRAITSRPTSPSICCPRSTNRRAGVCATTRRRATPRSAAGRWKRSRNFEARMSELETQIAKYLDELRRSGASAHTVRAYESDLRQFLEYFSPAGSEPPALAEFDVLKLREWLAGLYDQKLDRDLHAPQAGGAAVILPPRGAAGRPAHESGAAGAHAEGAEEAARGDDGGAGERAGRRRAERADRRRHGRRATAPCSNCSTAAACA